MSDQPTFAELQRLERTRQDKRWGEQNHQDPYWLTILGKGFGAVAEQIIVGNDTDQLQTELVQVAAICQAWCEAIERRRAPR